MRTYLAAIVVVAVVAVGGASVYGFAWSSNRARENSIKQMSLEAARAASAISSSIATARKSVAALAAQPGLDKELSGAAGALCQLSVEGTQAFPSVRLDLVGADGHVGCSSAPSPKVTRGRVHAGSRWLTSTLGSRSQLADWSAVDSGANEPAVVVASPVRAGGRAVGAVALFLHVPQAAPALASSISGIEHADFTVVDDSTHRVLSESAGTSTQKADRRAARFNDSRPKGEWTGLDGSRREFGSSAVAGSPWRVYAGVRRSAVVASARGTLIRQGLVGVLALLILGLAVWVLNRRVAGPLRALTDAVRRARGEPDGPRVEESGMAEMAALTHEFNSMLDVRAGYLAQLVHHATHDPLTGLPNRRLLRDRLDATLRREPNEGVGVLWFGIDRLDVVSDGFGHEAADRVLTELSERLQTALRSGETLARFGGEEFVVLAEALRDRGAELAARMQGCLDTPFRVGDSDVRLQGSIGITLAHGGAPGAEELFREADSARREAKRSGRLWLEFAHELQARATDRLAVEHALRRALREEELVVHYQPILDLNSGRLAGAEALVRWQDPRRGSIPPLEFIPTAEATGQITEIGRYVLTRACRQAAIWAAAGHRLRISVNVTVHELRDPGLPETIAEALSENGLEPAALCLEITESTLMREADLGSRTLADLKRIGVRLSIDDFGTGYSSLSYLHHVPADELKIDRSFIARLEGDQRNRYLVEAIVRMAQAIHVPVVAEGVETHLQLQLITELGCRFAQGHLLARPQPADGLLALLEKQPAQRRHAFVS